VAAGSTLADAFEEVLQLCVPKTSFCDDFGNGGRTPCSRARILCSAEIFPCSVAYTTLATGNVLSGLIYQKL